MMLKLETDPSEILNELIYSCRKALPVACCACRVCLKLFCADLCIRLPLMGCACSLKTETQVHDQIMH